MKPLQCDYRLQFPDQTSDWFPNSWKDNHTWVENLLSQDGKEFYGIVKEWQFLKEPVKQENGLIACDVKIVLEPGVCLTEEQAEKSLGFLLQTSEFKGLFSAERLGSFKILE